MHYFIFTLFFCQTKNSVISIFGSSWKDRMDDTEERLLAEFTLNLFLKYEKLFVNMEDKKIFVTVVVKNLNQIQIQISRDDKFSVTQYTYT